MKTYGATGNTRLVYDGACNTSTPTVLNSATANFTTADIGKIVTVGGAASGPSVLRTTIVSITSTTVAVMASGCTLTTSSMRVSIGTNDTAAFTAAISSAASAGGGSVYMPPGIYSIDPAGLSWVTGVGMLGEAPGWTSTTPDYPPFFPNSGSWLDCGYGACIHGSTIAGAWFANFGMMNFQSYAVSFGAVGVNGITNSWAFNVFGLGNYNLNQLQGASDTCWLTYNIEHFDTDRLFCASVNVGWHGISNGTGWSGFNSTWKSFYTYAYPKAVALGNASEPEIWIEAQAGAGIGSLYMINPQVNSYSGDGTGTHILLEGESGGYIHAQFTGIDMEGVDMYGLRCVVCNNGSFEFGTGAGTGITYGVSFDSISGLNNVISYSNDLTVQDLGSPSTNNYVGQVAASASPMPNVQGCYWDAGTAHAFVCNLPQQEPFTIFYNSPGNPGLTLHENGAGVPVLKLEGITYNWDLRVQGNDADELAIYDESLGKIVSIWPSFGDGVAIGRDSGLSSSGTTLLVKDNLASTGATNIQFQYGATQNINSTILTVNAGVVIDGPLGLTPVYFSSLPACASGNRGAYATVYDSSVNTWGAAITTGGGPYVVGAYCNGTNWKVFSE